MIERDPGGSVVSLGYAGSEMGYGANLVYYPCTADAHVVGEVRVALKVPAPWHFDHRC